MINFDFSNNNKPVAGSLLISEPFLADNHFSRSVIFLCEHNEKGSFGFVLNKYIDVDLSEIINELNGERMKISLGGPVDKSNIFFIHRLGDKIGEAQEILPGIYIGGRFEDLNKCVKEEQNNIENIRFFIGYSGWSPGQLDAEIDEHSWIVINGDNTDTLFNTSVEKLWRILMKKQGGHFKLMADFPINPSDN